MASTIQTVNQMASDTISDQQQSVKTTKAKTVKTKVSKKTITSQITSSTMTSTTSNTMEIIENTSASLELKQSNNLSSIVDLKLKNDDVEVSTPSTPSDDDATKLKSGKKKSSNSTGLLTGKKKSKKIKKSEAEKENISVCEQKMRILSNKLHKGKSTEHHNHNTESDGFEACSDNSSDDLRHQSPDDYTFTSIKDNPFILNSHTRCVAEKDTAGCINNQSVTNNQNLQQNFNPTVLGATSVCKQTERNSTSKSESKANQSSGNETVFSLPGRPHEDVLANIDVKHLKTVYLTADATSQSCKTQNRSIVKATKQGRSLAIKNLCRSFGDLSFINDGEAETYKHFLKRTKSVGDLAKFNSLLKYFKYYGVSVRVLRDSYTNLIGLGASEMKLFNGDHIKMQNEKSSFSKFDTLQKRNLIHVRSSDAGKAQEKFTEPNAEKKQNCRVCQKQVYKMEEIKAEKNIYHKNCFRCNECEKQLKVDNYQSHEGVLYCKAHFKLLFSPKVVEETAQDKPRKPELIIRENQPMELPPDVVRASDKPDLGLEELQQINIRSKFEAFEKSHVDTEKSLERTPSSAGVKRSASILSKLAKFQAKGLNTGVSETDLNGIPHEEQSESDQASSEDDEEADPDLVRAKRAQRERPVGLGNMNDIKTKFESGHLMSKEERREERKQEIQNIRSRLFMGKQARIKEMYQQAVAESEHGITSIGKKSEIDIGDKARSLKEKFEKGEIFKEQDDKVAEEDLEVFESAISKKSRSLFKELDASAAKNQLSPRVRLSSQDSRNRSIDEQTETNSNATENVVKHDEKVDDVQVETSDISSKFKFFETYRPAENEKKTFRITPPRDGVVKLPTPESESDGEESKQPLDTESAEKTHTATIMLNKFREMEQSKHKVDTGPRPLKCFTPPPDEGRRVYNESDSDMENMSEEGEYEDEEGEEDEEVDDEYNGVHVDARSADHLEDEALKQAQAAARAKQLRAKFEKWEANEIQREIQDGTINLYGDSTDENQIESARSIRAKFENMKETQTNQSTRPRYKVNRFVVNGTDVSNLAYEDAIQLFLNAQEPIIVEVRRRGFDDGNKLNCFNYDAHMSPTLAVIASSNTPNSYEPMEYCTSIAGEEALSTLKPIIKNPSDTSTISCQTELSAFDNESKEILFMRADSDLNSGTFFRRKDYHQTSVNVDTLDGCLRAEYDMEEITLRKSQSTENLGFTISYSTEEYSDSDSCSDDCLEECKDTAGMRDDRDFSLGNFPAHKYKVYVSDIVPNSLADRDGRLRQGDRILQINGQTILSKVDPNKLLAEYKHSVTILVSRNVYAGDDDFLDSAVYCDDKECHDDQHQSSICECEHTTYSSKSSISRSEQKSCTSTTMTNIYPVLPIAVENVSDLFNHANIKAQLESVNKEISLLNSQISTMKLQQLQTDGQMQAKAAPSPFKAKDRSSHVSTSIGEALHSTKSQVSRPEIEIEHIYETIPEDNESEAYYCSPYEGVNGIRVEQWLKSIGCSKGKTRGSLYAGEKHKHSATGQQSVQRLQKNNATLDDYDNSSSAYNTGGSCSSALLVVEQSNKLPGATAAAVAAPNDQPNSKKQPLRSQNKTQYVDKKCSENTASGGITNRISSSERTQPLSCSHRRAPVPSMCVPPAVPHTPDIDSDGHSTLIARSGSYKMCQYKVVAECKDEELSEVVWKVKRRPDGSRYIVRRVTKKCPQLDKSHDEESANSTEYRRQLHKFKERRQRSRNQVTPSNEKHHAQHWLV